MLRGQYTGLECCDALTALEHDTCGFVAEDTVSLDDESAYSSRFPEMDIRSGGWRLESALLDAACWSGIPANTRGFDM